MCDGLPVPLANIDVVNLVVRVLFFELKLEPENLQWKTKLPLLMANFQFGHDYKSASHALSPINKEYLIVSHHRIDITKGITIDGKLTNNRI